MPGLVPGIHVFLSFETKDVDGRDEPGHDEDIYYGGTYWLAHTIRAIHSTSAAASVRST
jgi:hypothetical protein